MNNHSTNKFSVTKIILIVVGSVIALILILIFFFQNNPTHRQIRNEIDKKQQQLEELKKLQEEETQQSTISPTTSITNVPSLVKTKTSEDNIPTLDVTNQTSIIPENTKIKISKADFEAKKEFIFNSLENDNIQPSFSLTPEEAKILQDEKENVNRKKIMKELQKMLDNLLNEKKESEHNLIILPPLIRKAKELRNELYTKIKQKQQERKQLVDNYSPSFFKNQDKIKTLQEEIDQLTTERKKIYIDTEEKENLLSKAQISMNDVSDLIEFNKNSIKKVIQGCQKNIEQKLLQIYEITDTNKIQ